MLQVLNWRVLPPNRAEKHPGAPESKGREAGPVTRPARRHLTPHRSTGRGRQGTLQASRVAPFPLYHFFFLLFSWGKDWVWWLFFILR